MVAISKPSSTNSPKLPEAEDAKNNNKNNRHPQKEERKLKQQKEYETYRTEIFNCTFLLRVSNHNSLGHAKEIKVAKPTGIHL